MRESITIIGAAENNLKHVSCVIPRGEITAVVGPSGSGKSTLVFDVLGAECRRRFLEPLGDQYAAEKRSRRTATGNRRGVRVTRISGVSLPVEIRGDVVPAGRRESLGTLSGVFEPLVRIVRRIGNVTCDRCGGVLITETAETIGAAVAGGEATSVWILAPAGGATQNGEAAPTNATNELTRDRAEWLLRNGFSRVLWQGERLRLEEMLPSLALGAGYADSMVFVDAIPLTSGQDRTNALRRLEDGVRTTWRLLQSEVIVELRDGNGQVVNRYWCAEFPWCVRCRRSCPVPTDAEWSFRTSDGACKQCRGLGVLIRFVPDESEEWMTAKLSELPELICGRRYAIFDEWPAVVRSMRLSPEKVLGDLGDGRRSTVFFGKRGSRAFRAAGCDPEEGSGADLGMFGWMIRWFCRRGARELPRGLLRIAVDETCFECCGTRYGPRIRGVNVGRTQFGRLLTCSIAEVLAWCREMSSEGMVRADFRRELQRDFATLEVRLQALIEFGLENLPLSRAARTLSTGESRRAAIARQLGSPLERIVYLFDEPTIGLDAASAERVVMFISKLVREGHTAVIVEHDPLVIGEATHLIELGPGGGERGGCIVYDGSVGAWPREAPNPPPALEKRSEIARDERSGELKEQRFLVASGITRRSLNNRSMRIPLQTFVAVSGPSGAGKTTAIIDVLGPLLARLVRRKEKKLTPSERVVFGIEALTGAQFVDGVVIGSVLRKSSGGRNDVCEAIGIAPILRDVFAQTPEARMRGVKSAQFRFVLTDTVREDGQCDFIRYRGKTYRELVSESVDGLIELGLKIPRIREYLKVCAELGLGYLSLSQKVSSLSSGERQRIRLVKSLAQRNPEGTVYLLDEPTAGLSSVEVRQLIGVFERLVRGGGTVVAIEHHAQVLSRAECVIAF